MMRKKARTKLDNLVVLEVGLEAQHGEREDFGKLGDLLALDSGRVLFGGRRVPIIDRLGLKVATDAVLEANAMANRSGRLSNGMSWNHIRDVHDSTYRSRVALCFLLVFTLRHFDRLVHLHLVGVLGEILRLRMHTMMNRSNCVYNGERTTGRRRWFVFSALYLT